MRQAGKNTYLMSIIIERHEPTLSRSPRLRFRLSGLTLKLEALILQIRISPSSTNGSFRVVVTVGRFGKTNYEIWVVLLASSRLHENLLSPLIYYC